MGDTTAGKIVKGTVEIHATTYHRISKKKTTQEGFPMRPKTLAICFLCIRNNIPYDLIRK
jgi:hypothetical protein